MAHTQGPWQTAERSGGIGIEHREKKSFGWLQSEVALVYPLAEPEKGTGAANAALIAAAPEMLEALERAYQKLGFWMDDDKWDDSDEAAMVQIWTAISKAKGAE